MCRLFAVRASNPATVHRHLVLEANALRHQSREHPDGWGIAFYARGTPTIARGIAAAHEDENFEQYSRSVESDTVVAHIRKASVGPLTLENTHPFEFGPWVMAHNGTVPAFEQVRSEIEAKIAPPHRARLRGQTDSERLFGLLLTALERRGDLLRPDVGVDDLFAAIEEAVRHIVVACRGLEKQPSLNVVVTNGRLLAAFRHGRSLFFSTQPGENETVTQLVLASERIGGDTLWHEIGEDEFVAVDGQMRFVRKPVSAPLGGQELQLVQVA